MPDYKHITTQTIDGVLVITITEGEIRESDLCYALRDEMVAAVDSNSPGNVIINLAQVRFIASLGLASLLALRHLPQVDQIVLCEPSGNVKELLYLCNLVSDDPDHPSPFRLASTVLDAHALITSSGEQSS